MTLTEEYRNELKVRAALLGYRNVGKMLISPKCWAEDEHNTDGKIPVIYPKMKSFPQIVFPCKKHMDRYLTEWGWEEV